MTTFDFFKLVTAFSGAILFVLGRQNTDQSDVQSFLAFIGLVANPFLLAGGVVAMRKMKNMHFTVVSAYVNIASVAIGLAGMLITSDSFSAFMDFSLQTWIIIIFSAFLVIVT